jgi:hypothetical protein
MNGYDLTAAIIQALTSLGWPIAFVTAAWIFKNDLKTLLPRLRLRYKDFDMSFRLNEAEKEAQKLLTKSDQAELPPPTPEEQDKLQKIAELSPREAILELYSEVEDAIQSFAVAFGLLQDGTQQLHWRSRKILIRRLRQYDLIDGTMAALLDDLSTIRNNAAHRNVALTTDDVLRFRTLTEKVIQQLDVATKATLMNKGPAPLPSRQS